MEEISRLFDTVLNIDFIRAVINGRDFKTV